MRGHAHQVAETRVLRRPNEGQCSHIVRNQGLAGELPDGIQNRCAEGLSVERGIGAQALFDALQAEFQVFTLVIFALTFDYSARNQQKSRAFLEAYGGSVRGRVGEKAQRQSRGREFGNASAVAEKSGRVPCVSIAERAKPLVVAADECRAGVNPRGRFHQAAVEAKGQRGHGFGFVDVGPRKELGSESVKYLLRSRENELIVLAASGDVEQAEQDAFGADPQGVVKISGDPFSVGGGGNLGTLDLGKLAGRGLQGRQRLGFTGMEESAHTRLGPEPKLAQALAAGKSLFAVLVAEVLAELALELAVVGMEGRAQGGFGGTALAQELQNSLDVAHAVSIVDVGNCSQ
jgi:hypothetical protein